MSEIKRFYHSDRYVSEFIVNLKWDKGRLDQFVQEYYPSLSRHFIQNKIKNGDIFIKGRDASFKTKPNTRMKFQDVVCMHVESFGKTQEFFGDRVIELDKSLPIVTQTMDYIVVNKPPFMLTHPSGRQLFHCVTNYLQEKLGQEVYSVHRLDKETSGLIVLAKNVATSSALTIAFSQGRVQKCYFLIGRCNDRFPGVDAFPLAAKEALCPLEATEHATGLVPKSMEEKVHPSGQSAHTDFILLGRWGNYIAALAFPKTGRQHQIRLHAAYHGFPLIGDKLYLQSPELFYKQKEQILSPEDLVTLGHYRHILHAVGLKLPGMKEFLFASITSDLVDWMKENIPQINITELEAKICSILK